MRHPVTLSLVFLASGLALSLAGCSLNVVDPRESVPPTTAAESHPTATQPPASASSSADAPVSSSPAPERNSDSRLTRDGVRAAATSTVSCDGVLQLTQDGGVIVVDGPCDHLVVSLNAAAILVGNVGTLEITGDGSLVYAGTVSTLRITGEGNAVYFTGAAPAVSDSGSTNIAKAG